MKRYLSTKEVCEYLGISHNTVRRRCDEWGATTKFGRIVRFDRYVIDKEVGKDGRTKFSVLPGLP